jgi:hypothetical protein
MSANRPEQTAVRIQLMVFSGRPDPEWELEDATLLDRVRAVIGREPVGPPAPGGLGYRGFLITNLEREVDVPAVTVFRGAVTEQGGKTWRDTADVEVSLLEDASRRGYDDILKKLGLEGGTATSPA